VIVVGAVITASCIGWGVVSLVGVLGHEEETTTVAFPAGVRHLDVRLDDGPLVLRGTATDQVSGTRRISRGLGRPTVTETVTGDTLTIRAHCPAIGDAWCSTGYTLDVPRSVSVTASSDGDHIEASGIDGDLDLRSSAGGIRVTDAGGELRLDSSAGAVEATELTGTRVRATSSAGGVSLVFTRAPEAVVATSAAGSVDIELPTSAPAYRVDAHSSAGPTEVDVPTDPRASRTIEATSSAGPVTIRRGPG
jgi:hypothetical protein